MNLHRTVIAGSCKSCYHGQMFALSKQELAILRKLNTPIRIQNYLDSLPINWEKQGETCMSPRRVLREKKAHCLEGAMLAAAALWLQGQEPLVFDLKSHNGDDHILTLYKKNSYWGAISKTNHGTVRWRDPIFKTTRELALSYFHEYFDVKTGEKILRSFSKRPFNLKTLGDWWVTAERDLFDIGELVDEAPHEVFIPSGNSRHIRNADSMERRIGREIEWKKADKRT